MNIQAQNFQTGQRLTAKDLNDLKNAVMNPNISLGDGLVGSSGNGSITIQKSESLNKKAKEYTNTVWQLKSAPSQRFIHEDSDGNRYPSLYVYVGSTLANAFENINIQNQWIAQGTKPTALYLLNGKESPKCTTYLAEVDEKGAITKGDEVDISLDTAASQTQIDLQSDFYAKDKDIGIDGWLELPVAIVDATGTYMCVFEQGPLLAVGLFFCDLTVEQNVETNSQDETNNFISYSIEPNLVDIVSQLVTSDYGWGGMIGNPVPMFSCRPLADYETLKTDFLDNDMVVDFEKFKIISQFRNTQQFQFIDTVSQMPYAFKPVFIRGSVNDPGQDLSSINVGWVLNMIVPEVETPSSYDADGVRDNVYASSSSIRKVPALESIPKIILPGDTPYREIDVTKVYRLTQVGIGGSAIYVAPLNASTGAPDADTFPVTDLKGTFRNEDGQTGGINPVCLAGAIDALIVTSNVSLPIDDNSKTILLKCIPVWSLQLGTWIYGFWVEQSSIEALDGFNVGSRNGVKNTDQIVAALLPNTKQAFVESSSLANGEKIQLNIGFNKNLKLRPLTPAYTTVDLRNIAAAMPFTDSQFIDGLKRQNAQYKNMTTVSQTNYEQLSAEMTNEDNQDLGNKLFSRSGSLDYRIIRPGGTNDSETFAKANYPIELMGFGLVPPISVDANRNTPDYENNVTDLSDIIKNDIVIRHYWQDQPGDLTTNSVGQVIDYINMQSLLSAWTELCCQTSVDISAITDAVLSADNADWQNRYFLKCRVNDDPEDYNYGKVQVFLGKTTSRLDAHCTVGGMPVNYYRDKNGNTLTSDDKGWCTLPYSPGSKLYYWIGAEWDSGYSFYKYTFYITDVQMIPSFTGKDIVREEGFLYYQNANPNAYAYDLADYTTTGDVRKTNIDDASTWANRIYNIHLGDIHCNPFPNEIEPFTFGLGRDGYWKVYEGGDYLVYYNNEPINKHGSMLAVSIPPYGYNSGDGWADTNIPLTADVNLYFVFSNGSGSSQSMPEWDFVNGYPMPFSNGIRLVAGSNWDGTGIPTEITQYHKGKVFIDYTMGDSDYADYFNPYTKSYSIVRNHDKNDHFTLYQFGSTAPTQSNKVLQWSDTDPEDIDDSLQFAVKAVGGGGTNTLEYIIPLIDAGRVNDLSAAIDELSGSVPTPGDIEQMLLQLSADILDSTDDKYWHLGNQTASEAYGSVIGNSSQNIVIDLDNLELGGSDWTVVNGLNVENTLTAQSDFYLNGTLHYDGYEWDSHSITFGNDFMRILVASDAGDPTTVINGIEAGIRLAIEWSDAVIASDYGTYQGVLQAIGNAAQAAQNAQNAANAAQGAADAAQAGVNALDSQINGANGIDARLSAAESSITSLDTRYNLLSGDVDTIGNQLNIQGQAIHDIANAISGDIVPAINNISSVVNNNVTQITNIDGRVTNIENNYTTVTNNLSNLSTDVGTLSSGLSTAQSSIDSINQNKADLSALNDLSDSLSNYLSVETDPIFTNWKDGEFIEAGLSAQTSAYVSSTLPYDAELEYIEKTSTGESYFNITGYTPLWNDKIQAKFSTTENRTKFFYMAREGGNKPSRGFLKMATSGQFRVDGTNGTASVTQNFTPANPSYTLGEWFEVYDNGSASVQMFGGAGGTQSYSGSSGTVNGYLRIFSGNGYNSWGQMKFGYFRAWSGNSYDSNATLAVDLIPVRVGNAPRIYDRATNTLYSPSGANDIVCGPDKRRTAVAIGSQASAQEQNIAIGSTATAGPNPVNGKVTSIAMGDGAKAKNGIAIGNEASASDNYFANQMQPVAIGRGAKAKGTSVSIGSWADSGGTTSDSVGQQNISIGRIAGPRDKDKTGVINIGYNAQHPNLQNDAVAIGTIIGTVGSSGVAIGKNSQQSGGEGVAVGLNANGNGQKGISIGHDSAATGTRTIAMGYNAKASQNYSVAVGQEAKTTGSSGTGAIAFGSGAQANSNGGVALGGAAAANYDTAIAIGKFVESNAANAITIGGTIDSNNHITNTLGGSVQFWNWTAFKRNSDNSNLILDTDRLQQRWEVDPSDISCSFSNVASGFSCSLAGVAVNRIAGLVRLRINIVNTAARTAASSVNVATIAFTGFTPLLDQFRWNGCADINRQALISTNSSWQIYIKPIWAMSSTQAIIAFTLDLATNSFSL